MKSFIKWSLMAIMSVAALMPAIVFAEFPEKPITYTIPFNPGGESDITARLQEPELEKYLGVDVNVISLQAKCRIQIQFESCG